MAGTKEFEGRIASYLMCDVSDGQFGVTRGGWPRDLVVLVCDISQLIDLIVVANFRFNDVLSASGNLWARLA